MQPSCMNFTIMSFSIDPSDIVDGNMKLIMSLLTELIHHYHIKVTVPTSVAEKSASMSNRVALLEWLKAVLPENNITNLTTSWNDGLALSALVDYCMPGLIPNHASLDPKKRLENVQNAMDVAEKELGVPQILYPQDIACQKPEEFFVMGYLAYFCNPQLSGQKRLLEWVNTFLPSKKITDFGSRWEDGRLLYVLVQSILPRVATPLDILEDQSSSKLKQQAKELVEGELDIKAPKSLAIATGEEFQLTLIMFLRQLQAQVKSPIPADTLLAEGSGLTGVNVNEDAVVTVLGDIPSSDNLSVIVTEPSGLLLYVDETPPCSFLYTPDEHGEHTIDITFYGQPIAGTPFKVIHVDKDLVTKCKLSGKVHKACVDTPLKFTVDCSEAGVGEVQVVAETDKGDQIPASVTQKSGNTHDVIFTPASIGEHLLHITWNKVPLPNSPFKCQVINPSRCEASGPGLSNAILGRPAIFNICANGAGEGSPSATVSGPTEPVDLALLSNENGMYTYEYTPTQRSSYHIDIKFSGFPVHGSPFIIRPQTPTAASGCTVKNFPRTSVPTNEPLSIVVSVEGASNGQAELIGTFILEDSEDEEAECDVAKISGEDNLYKVSFVPQEVGVYTVHIQYAGLEIPECPLDFAVNDPSKCIINHDSNTVHHTEKPVSFRVNTEEAGYGVLTANGVDPSDQSFKLKVTESDELDKYTVSFVPKEGGKHLITLLYDSRSVLDSPLCVQVSSGTLNNIVLSKPVSQHGYVLVDKQVNYKMFAPCRSESCFAVECLGVNTGAIPKVSIEPVGEDSYNISFKATHPDEYKVQITYNGQQIPGSPFTVNVNQLPQPDRVVSFDPIIPLQAGKPIELTFDASIAGGSGTGTLTANISSISKNWIIPTVSEISPAFYKISFVPPRVGRYTASVFWYGKQIKDSPFVLDFEPQSKLQRVSIEFEPDPSERRLLSATATGQKTKIKPKVHIQQFEPGKYQLGLTPVQSDVYELRVFWFDREIKGSPFTLDLQTAISRPSTANGVREISALVVGEKSGPQQASMTVNKKKNKATITFEDRKRDVYNLSVFLNQRIVPGAPFKIDVSS